MVNRHTIAVILLLIGVIVGIIAIAQFGIDVPDDIIALGSIVAALFLFLGKK